MVSRVHAARDNFRLEMASERGGARRYPDLGVTVEVVTAPARLAELAEDYAHVERVGNATLPFTMLEWHLAWWNQFARTTPTMRSRLRVHVVRDEAGACLAIVPFVLEQRPGVGPIGVRMLSFMGRDPWITELRAPLVDPTHGERAGKAIRRALADDRGWDWIYWSGLNRAGVFGETLLSGQRTIAREPLLDYVMDLAPTWDEFRASLKRNIRESLRHCYNSLKREGHVFELQIATSPADVRRACEIFLELHGQRAEVTGTVTHPNRFESKAAQQFLFEIADRGTKRGSTHVFSIVIGGKTVACRIGFIVGQSLYLYYSGYDPAWSKYGVMTTAVAEAIKFAIERKLTTVNLSAGTDVSKTRWGPRCEEYDELIEPRETLRARLGFSAFRMASDTSQAPRFLQPLLRRLPRRSWS
jgi:CelD/BcsL family acetyltransferase involved in cellulose biosynthesis